MLMTGNCRQNDPLFLRMGFAKNHRHLTLHPDASKAQPEPQPEASIFALEVGAAAAAVELDHPLYNNGEVSEGGEGGRLHAGGRGGCR